jgi:hypothetical protein
MTAIVARGREMGLMLHTASKPNDSYWQIFLKFD